LAIEATAAQRGGNEAAAADLFLRAGRSAAMQGVLRTVAARLLLYVELDKSVWDSSDTETAKGDFRCRVTSNI
jgi:hypothetical protein